jgi:hypothetical protein
MNKKNQLDQAIDSVHKMILGFIPGGHVWQEVMEYHGNIRQQRLNKFSELLAEFFTGTGGLDIDLDKLKSEEFVDAFEVIIRKVMTTSKEEKLLRLSNILIRQMFKPDDSDLFVKFVEFIDDINEVQILLLDEIYRLSYYQTEGRPPFGKILGNAKPVINVSIGDDVYFETILADRFGISNELLRFYMLDLSSKGMIMVHSLPNQNIMKAHNFDPLSYKHEITAVGMEFIHFVTGYSPEKD